MTDGSGPRSAGAKALAWVRDHSPVLGSLAEEFGESRPFEGHTVAVSAPLTPHTGVFVETLHAAGAGVLFCGEPGTNHADVIAELDALDGVEAFVEAGMPVDAYEDARRALLDREPEFVFDDGCALLSTVHEDRPEVARSVVGGAEQTTAGVTRLKAMEREGVLAFPVYAVNDTPMKRVFDNVHGTAESTLSAILATTNTTLAGKTMVVAGYGYCGRGIARKARGMGAQTVVTEVDPRKALEAHTDGHRVLSMAQAAPVADYVVTATGNRDVVREEHFAAMADGTVLATAGTEAEFAVDDLAAMATGRSAPREGVTRYRLSDGRRLDLLADGYVVNLAAPNAAGNPTEVMDTTFAMMALAAHDLLTAGDGPSPGLYDVPDRLDRAVAERKLETLGVEVDTPTDDQRAYVDDWRREGDRREHG